jgi:hypothetical protein
MLDVVGVIFEWLHEVPASILEAQTREGEKLVGVEVRHLVACYQSTDTDFLLAPVHAAASDEVESITKEDPKIDAAITKDAPWLRWA